ncbi:hypothetical protein BCR36DRAFT_110151, partial [Piromyces finnis]
NENNINRISDNSLTEEQFDILLNQTVNSDIFQISSLQFNISTDHSRDVELFEPPEVSIEKIKQELNDMNFFDESNENRILEEEVEKNNNIGQDDNIDFNFDLINNKILNLDSINKSYSKIEIIKTTSEKEDNLNLKFNKDNIIIQDNNNILNNNSNSNSKSNNNDRDNNNKNNTCNNSTNINSVNKSINSDKENNSQLNNLNCKNKNNTNNTFLDEIDKSMGSFSNKVSTAEFLKSELNSNNTSLYDINIGNKKSLVELFKENKSVESLHSKINSSFNLSLSNSLSNKPKINLESTNLLSKSPEKSSIINNKTDNSIVKNLDLNFNNFNQSQINENLNNQTNNSLSSIILSASKQTKDQNSSFLFSYTGEQSGKEDLNNFSILNNQHLSKPPLPKTSQSFIIDNSNIKNNVFSNSLSLNLDKATSSNNSIISNLLGKSQSLNKSFLNSDNEEDSKSLLNKSQSSKKSFLNSSLEGNRENRLNKSQSSNKSFLNTTLEDINKNMQLNKSQTSSKILNIDSLEDIKNNQMNKSQSSNKSVLGYGLNIVDNTMDEQNILKKESSVTLYDTQKENNNEVNFSLLNSNSNIQEAIQVNNNEVSFDRQSIYEYINTMNKENNTSMTDNSIYNYIFNIKNTKNANQTTNDKLEIKDLIVDNSMTNEPLNPNNISLPTKSLQHSLNKSLNANTNSQNSNHLNSFVNSTSIANKTKSGINNNNISTQSIKEHLTSVNTKTNNSINNESLIGNTNLRSSQNSSMKTIQQNNSLRRNSIQSTEKLPSINKFIEEIRNKYNDLPSAEVNRMVLKELTEECQHLKNLNEVQLKLNKELESRLELKNKENKNEMEQLKEKYETMMNNIQEADNKKTSFLQNQINILEKQLIETNESQAQIASMQRNFQQQQEINILNIKRDLTKKYEEQLQELREILQEKNTFIKKLESDHQLKQAEYYKEKSNLQEELVKIKENNEEKDQQIINLKERAEKPITKEFSQQFDKGLEEKQEIITNYKTEMDSVRLLLYTNINYVDDFNREHQASPSSGVEYPSNSKSHEKYLKSLSLKQLVQTYIEQVNRSNEQISKLKIIDRNKNDYVREMEKQIENLEVMQKQIMMENQNSIAMVENNYIKELKDQKDRYENDIITLKNQYDKIQDTLQQKEEQLKEIASKKTFPKSSLKELLEIYPNEFEEFKSEIESVVWKKLDEAWHARFKEDLTTASSRITQHCSEAYASAIAKLKTQSVAFKNKLENEFEKKFKKYVDERNKETQHLKYKYEQNQKQLDELKKQLNESKKTVKSLSQITYQHSQTEEKYHQALLDMKALYKSRLKKMYEDISKKKKEWIDQKITIEKEWENRYKTLKSEYYDKLRKAENELKIIKRQMPLKQRSFTDINEIDSHPDKERLHDVYTESEYYSNPEDESYMTSQPPNNYYSRN